jgi:DNA-binding transcriptional regulator YiaG
MVKKTYRSRALGALHEAVKDVHRAGLVDAETMRQFDASCLTQAKEGGIASSGRTAKKTRDRHLCSKLLHH